MVSLWYDYDMKVAYNLRMEKDLKDRLDAEAKAEGRSFNNLVNHILCEHVAERIVKKHLKEKDNEPKIGDIVGGTPFPSPITDDKIWQAYVDEHMATTVRSELGDYPYRDKCRTCPYSGTIKCTITGRGFGGLACTLEREEKRKENEDGKK